MSEQMKKNNMSEQIMKIPLLDQAAAQIKESGSFQQDLTGTEVATIMESVVSGLLTGQDVVKVNVPPMDVRIQNEQGIVQGSVVVEKPIKAQIGLNIVLGNDQYPQKLKLIKLDVNEKAGIAAKVALKAVNIKGKAKQALRDPNKALFTALGQQLESRGVKLTGIGLHFGNEALALKLQGSSR